MEIKPTLKEIASRANVSIATASRAIKNPEKVKYSTRRKIEQVLEEYSLEAKKKGSGIIGFIVPDLTNQFFPMMLTGIETVAKANQYQVVITQLEANGKNEDEIVSKLVDIGVDGIIIIPSAETTGKYIRQLVKDDLKPIVFLDRNPGLNNVNFVTTDNYSGMYQATKYLLTLGHKNFLYLDGKKGTSTARDRYEGFVAATENKVNIRRITADFNATKAREELSKLLNNADFPYTAILSANDTMAIAAMGVLKEKNIRVPEDVSVLGYDDIPNAKTASLSTIKQPFVEMGMNAMYILLSSIKNPISNKKTIVLPSNIVFRSSVAIAKQIRQKDL